MRKEDWEDGGIGTAQCNLGRGGGGGRGANCIVDHPLDGYQYSEGCHGCGEVDGISFPNILEEAPMMFITFPKVSLPRAELRHLIG